MPRRNESRSAVWRLRATGSRISCAPISVTSRVILRYGNRTFGLRAGLPGLLLHAGAGGERPRHPAARRPQPSGHARVPVRQGRAIPGARIFARPPALSAKARRRQRRRPLRADFLGRSARYDRSAVRQRSPREFGPEAILPYSYGGTLGMLNGGGMDRRFFHRLGASRLDRTICATAGGAGLTAANGFRYATEPEQFRLSKLIIAWGANIHGANIHLWPFIVEARRNGAKLVVIDPIRTRTAALADQHLRHQPRQRSGAGAGPDARDHRRKTARRRLRGPIHQRLRRAARTRRELSARACGRAHRHRGRGHRATGARLCHHAARGDPRELRRAAQRARRRGGARDRGSSGADRIVARGRRRIAAFHVAGVPVQPRGSRDAGAAESLGAGTRGAHREYEPAGQGSHGAGRAAGQGDGGVQLESGRRSRRIRMSCFAVCVARTCSPWSWNSSRPTRPTTPTSCCPPPRSWSTPTSISRTGITTCRWRGRRCRLPARRARTWTPSARWRCGWVSTTPVSATPKTT